MFTTAAEVKYYPQLVSLYTSAAFSSSAHISVNGHSPCQVYRGDALAHTPFPIPFCWLVLL